MDELGHRTGHDNGEYAEDTRRSTRETGTHSSARDSLSHFPPEPLRNETNRLRAWVELLKRDLAEQGAENTRLRRDNAELREQNAALQSDFADLKKQVAGLAAKDARRDQADARRDSEIATLRWNDVQQDDRLDSVERRPDADPPTALEHEAPGIALRSRSPEKQRELGSPPEDRRRSPSNEAIGFLAATGTSAVALGAEYMGWVPPHLVNSSAAILGMGSTGIAWLRAIRKDKHGDRSQDRAPDPENAWPRHPR